GPHLGQSALDHPAAAQSEERVAGEEHLLLRQVEHDMALGMAWRRDHLHLASGKLVVLAVRHREIDARDLARFRLWADDPGIPFSLESEIAFDMVDMMMRGEDMAELPPLGG